MEPTQASSNETKFDGVVKALLADGLKHRDLKERLGGIVAEEGKKLPPVRVLFCGSHGGYDLSEEFGAYCERNSLKYHGDRDDPALLQGISDYGRFLCEKFPRVYEDMQTSRTWKLAELMDGILRGRSVEQLETEFPSDLAKKATQMPSSGGDGFDLDFDDETNFEPFVERNPDTWTSHGTVLQMRKSLQFARILLKDDFATYHVERDSSLDPGIYEFIGLCGASTVFSHLRITEIPALVDYKIKEYDGLERVDFSYR